MNKNSKLMNMLTGYAAAHQHPVNIGVHMVGIPSILFGALVALSWVSIEFGEIQFNLAWLLVIAFFLFYLSLDALFALVFLIAATLMTFGAMRVGELDFGISASVAAVTFIGGYVAQFIGHAIEKSQPVLLKHPVQAQLAAPFFTVVELFQIFGLRDELFNEVQRRVKESATATRPDE